MTDELTVYENVELPLIYTKTHASDRKKKVDEVLQKMDMAHRSKHFPQQLSCGQQQRVAVARSLINRPSVIFADEPSGNLDSANANDLHQLFFKLREEYGQTFVIVTHNDELAQMADRKLVMSDGKIVT